MYFLIIMLKMKALEVFDLYKEEYEEIEQEMLQFFLNNPVQTMGKI